MANYTQGDTRPVLQQADAAKYQANGSLVLDLRRTRPLWFDGRFLAARDLEREQNYFLLRQADLGRSPGFGVIRGLAIDAPVGAGAAASPDTIMIRAGQGITPAGEFVRIPFDVTVRISDLVEEPSLDAQFGLSTTPPPTASNRTGMYVIGLRPVQFTANSISAFPLTVQGARGVHDGDLVEATALALIPYPDPAANANASTRRAALARQIFVAGNPGPLSDSVLPLAMIGINAGAIDWIDQWMVRRETGSSFSGLRFGLTDPPTQQAFLQQYDAQLQETVNTFVQRNQPPRFAASDYFQALPPAGRFPIAGIDAGAFSQLFFPPQVDVRISIVPDDELPALLADGMALPPIDLTLDPGDYTNLTIFALIPTPREGYSELAAKLPAVALTPILPQVLGNRLPIDLLRFYRGDATITRASSADNSNWQSAIGTQTYGYYLRRRSSAPLVIYTTPPPPTTTTTAKPTTTTATTTSTTAAPTTTTTATSTTTVKPTTTTTTTTTTPKPTTTTTTTTTTPGPLAIASITPSTLTAGGPDATVTVNGSGFTSATTLLWTVLLTPGAPVALVTTFVSSTQLKAVIPASLTAAAATGSISAHIGSQSSNAVNVTVTPAPLVITSIAPTSGAAGGPAFTLTVNGSGFTNLAVVNWNTTPLATTFVSPTQLSAAVPAALVVSAGTASVSVSSINQPTSASVPFTIAPALTITSVAPNPFVISAGAVPGLTVTGTGFTPGTQVFWGQQPVLTTVVSATQMTAVVPASIISPSGSISITARQGSLSSPPVTLTIATPAATLSGISPTSANAGAQGITLTVNGSQFTSANVVTWNGTALVTTFVSGAQLTAAVPAALLTTPGTATVTINGQPQPAPVTFTINKPLPLPTNTLRPPTTLPQVLETPRRDVTPASPVNPTTRKP